jgi:hypothetical protein
MTEPIIPADDRHEDVQRLLPWYVTDRLDPAERAGVAAHLETCADCRAELAIERRLAAAVAGQRDEVAPDWNRFAARLDAQPQTPPRRRTRDAFAGLRRAAGRPGTLRWVVAAQFAAVAVLGGALVAERRPGAYQALGDQAEMRGGNALVMFDAGMSEAAFRRTLQARRARLVDGPTAAGAYVLDLPEGELVRLRGDAGVTMAEPIERAPAE